MDPARSIKDRLDGPVASHKRRVLQSKSSQAHHGRRGTTSITLRISPAISQQHHFLSSESAFYDAILQREHHFYNRVSRGATLVNEIYKKVSNYKNRFLISLGQTHSA